MAQKHDILYTEKPMTVGTQEQGPQKRYRRLRFPSFSADVWSEKNPLLQKGELGHESDTGRFKVGDGFTYWSDLPYNSVGEKGERGDDATINGLKTATLAGGLNIDIKQEGDTITISAQGEASGSYSKEEIDNKISVVNAGIDANALAIQKTRDDYMSADTDIMTIVNNHAEELTALRGNQASLGDQVAGIESKIPESASGTNPLITKQQLLDEEMDIRDDLNEGISELQTQITAQATAISNKVDLSGDTMTGGLTLPELTVETPEGALNISVTAGVATIATNNGLDIASQTKFDTAPTTDDSTTWANASGVSLVRKAQVATAISDAVANIDALPDQTGNAGKVLTTDGSTASWQEAPASGTKVIIKRYN